MQRALPLFLPLLAQAHDGHGAPGISHWHATDTWGLVVFATAVVLVVWAGRRK